MNIEDFRTLFEAVQLNRIFPDSKTFVDCTPKFELNTIEEKYTRLKSLPGFDLKTFVVENFELPVAHTANYKSDRSKNVAENIKALWSALTREPKKENDKGSLIPLPYPYIVPGGRFGEIYYWDSYFTMLGLKESGRTEMIENMIRNFSSLIDKFGFIPNGNRTYFTGRSQPPFFSLMIELLASINGESVFETYLPYLEKEYEFWMNGISNYHDAKARAIQLAADEVANRYWDSFDTPRPESYVQDIELSQESKQDEKSLFRHLRAGAESGWDYSSRWFEDGKEFSTIHTADILPVDLNCLLYNLEKVISKGYELSRNMDRAFLFKIKSEQRGQVIQKYCWNGAVNFFCDYDLKHQKQKEEVTLAGAYPLFFNIATEKQAEIVAEKIKTLFLKQGGLITTLKQTDQQWDAPNGWAPLQWMTIIGLENYGYPDLAKEIATRWVSLNRSVFKRTGKMMEKYNVENIHLDAGGGEYEGQDGFGWTNGVYLALANKYKL